nr:hypothetical protein CFP56_46177 [Quercus suber]
MVSMVLSSLAAHSSSLYHYHLFPHSSPKQTYTGFSLQSSRPISKRALRSVCFLKAGDENSKPDFQDKETGLDWPILKRWDVPWEWQTVSLTSLACRLRYWLRLTEAVAIPYLGICLEDLNLDEKVEILFLDQGITTAVVLGVLYTIANKFQPLPEDVYHYDLREPFSLQKGWLLWAGIGLGGAVMAVALTGAALSFGGESPQRACHLEDVVLRQLGCEDGHTVIVAQTTKDIRLLEFLGYML